MLTRIRHDTSVHSDVNLRSEKITENDLVLINGLGLRDWNDKEFDREILVKFGRWVINEDKSIIFKGLGGGAFEIPEMFDFVYEGQKIRLECGGGGDPARTHATRKDQTQDCIVHVTRIRVPPTLVSKRDSLLTLIVKAFAVDLGPYVSGDVVVEFNT
jgi:hypothetical protein